VLGVPVYFAWKNRQMRIGRQTRRALFAGLTFISPWVIGFIIFLAVPIVASIVLSFTEYDVLHPARWTGFKNYIVLITDDPLFWKSLWNTTFMLLEVPLGMAIGLAVALLLNAKLKGMAFYRTIFYLPAVVPLVASAILWIWILQPSSGLINSVLRIVGIEGPLWLQSPVWSKPSIILMTLWSAGSGMVVWLAGLQGIPEVLYEAAEIDGAGRWAKFRHVTLPMLSPYIFYNLVMGIIGTFQIFTKAYIMTQGGPVDSTLFYVYALFNNAFRYFRMGYASAMAWILFIIILVFTLIQIKLSKKWVYYEEEEK
jgi:multiple sugar transport system permease protein